MVHFEKKRLCDRWSRCFKLRILYFILLWVTNDNNFWRAHAVNNLNSSGLFHWDWGNLKLSSASKATSKDISETGRHQTRTNTSKLEHPVMINVFYVFLFLFISLLLDIRKCSGHTRKSIDRKCKYDTKQNLSNDIWFVPFAQVKISVVRHPTITWAGELIVA